jgi:hypothetical protein
VLRLHRVGSHRDHRCRLCVLARLPVQEFVAADSHSLFALRDDISKLVLLNFVDGAVFLLQVGLRRRVLQGLLIRLVPGHAQYFALVVLNVLGGAQTRRHLHFTAALEASRRGKVELVLLNIILGGAKAIAARREHGLHRLA